MPSKASTSTTGTNDTADAESDASASSKVQRIPGMKTGWYYNPTTLVILHGPPGGEKLTKVGIAPKVTGVVSHLTDDGLPIRIEYLVLGPRQRKPRIVTEDELERGTWASKLGVPRPVGAEARQAYANVIHRQAEDPSTPVIPARAYYNEAGDFILPDKDAQSFGYMTYRGTEEYARDAWNEIGAAAANDPHAALAMGAFFVGPLLDSLQVHAHILNGYGDGQMGKSTIQTTCAATMGDIKPKQQQLMIPWNSSKQGHPQGLRVRGYMPVCFEEHSSSGRTPKQSGPEFSQIVSGAMRAMGTADGSPRESDGFFHSLVFSSSNKPLRWQGQTEDLASRLLEIPVPFFANQWVDPDGNPVDPKAKGAEHLSKRLKRLARSAGGWPLVWADRLGMFKAPNLEVLRKRHLELCAKHSPRTGGIPDTIAEIYMAWVVGAEMLGKAIGDDVEDALPEMAEYAAAQLLRGAIEEATDANVPDGERLWYGLDAIRIEAFAFPPIEEVAKAATDGFHKVKGFVHGNHWYVTRDVVQDVATREGLDNVGNALSQLEELGVHLREKAAGNRSAAKRLPKYLREQKTGLPMWMHCFDTGRADELWALDEDSEAGEDQTANEREPAGTTPGTTAVVPENSPLTSTGTTGTTGTTISENTPIRSKRERLQLIEIMDPLETVSGTDAGVVLPLQRKPSAAETDRPSTPPDTAAGPAEELAASRNAPVSRNAEVSSIYPQPDPRVTDPDWDKLAPSAAQVGVLATDGLHLPNRVPVPMALPASIDDLVPLMTAYKLQVLYLHQNVIQALGLPTLAERLAAKVGTGRGAEHAWATPASDSPIISIFPAGLSSWMSLTVATGPEEGDTTRFEVAVPAYETRFHDDVDDANGFAGPADGATLLEAVMIWTLSTAETNKKTGHTRSFRYYRSANRTGEDLAGGKGTKQAKLLLCQAIRDNQVPPALLGGRLPKVAPRSWSRSLTPAEREAGWLHQYDKTAAWLAAYSTVEVGIGEPEHAVDGIAYNPKQAGFWRVAEIPGHGLDGLPKFEFNNDPESEKYGHEYDPGAGHWLRTPGLELLREVYPGWEPDVLEAWYWPDTRRALYDFYQRMKNSRNHIVDAIEAGRPGAGWAKSLHGRIYQSFWGYLQRTAGPQTDNKTGGTYASDIYWRPDWSGAFVELACANTYRNLMKFKNADGQVLSPVTIHVDAVTYASDEPNPTLAKPAAMVLGNRGGQWKPEGSAPMAELLPLLSDKADVHKALNIYLKSKGER
ncbi:MAG: DUF927 domain-containing protein [Catenulispora sp.]